MLVILEAIFLTYVENIALINYLCYYSETSILIDKLLKNVV